MKRNPPGLYQSAKRAMFYLWVQAQFDGAVSRDDLQDMLVGVVDYDLSKGVDPEKSDAVKALKKAQKLPLRLDADAIYEFANRYYLSLAMAYARQWWNTYEEAAKRVSLEIDLDDVRELWEKLVLDVDAVRDWFKRLDRASRPLQREVIISSMKNLGPQSGDEKNWSQTDYAWSSLEHIGDSWEDYLPYVDDQTPDIDTGVPFWVAVREEDIHDAQDGGWGWSNIRALTRMKNIWGDNWSEYPLDREYDESGEEYFFFTEIMLKYDGSFSYDRGIKGKTALKTDPEIYNDAVNYVREFLGFYMVANALW